jgi:hypothetical protein
MLFPSNFHPQSCSRALPGLCVPARYVHRHVLACFVRGDALTGYVTRGSVQAHYVQYAPVLAHDVQLPVASHVLAIWILMGFMSGYEELQSASKKTS